MNITLRIMALAVSSLMLASAVGAEATRKPALRERAAPVALTNSVATRPTAMKPSIPIQHLSAPHFAPHVVSAPHVAGLSGTAMNPTRAAAAGRLGGSAPYDARHGAVIGGAAIATRH